MNITALYTLYYLHSQSQYVASDINVEIAQSVRYVIDNYFMKYSSSFVYILWCPREHTMNFFKDLMELLFSYWTTMKVQIVLNDISVDPIGPGERNFNLILVDCWQSFLKIDPASKVKNYNINEYYYVFVQNRDMYLAEDIQKVFDYCWKHYIINVNILVQKASGELIIYTYFPFTAAHCGKVVPVEINRYRNGTMDNKDIFPEKLSNMHQCPVKAALWHVPPFLSLDVKQPGRDAIGGFEGELLKALSDSMNFRIDYIVPPNNEAKGRIIGNKTTGAIHMLESKQVDLSLGVLQFTIDRANILTPTDTYYQTRQIIFVLHESPNYLSPELMFYPFSPTIWLMLITTCSLVLGILMCIICWTRRISLEVTSSQWNNICLHFFATTLGMPSVLSPRSHFGRLFMSTWMLSTLIIRAEYQALIFHLVRHNFFKLPPKTIDELIQRGYTFIMNPITHDELTKVPFFRETNLKIKGQSNLDGLLYSYLEDNPDKKLAAVTPNDFLLHYGYKHRRPGMFVALREAVLVQSINIYLTKHSYLVDRINFLLRWMNSYGMITSWVSKALDLSYFMVPPEPKLATIGQDELEGIYSLCGILLMMSSIVFIIEILSVRCRILGRAFEKFEWKFSKVFVKLRRI